jgi:hypothetical protein
MASFTLDIDEFAAMVGFLNAKKIVGMDERLFAVLSSETNLPRMLEKLKEHGWMTPADRPNTWHANEDLVETLAVAVAPHFAILGRSKARAKSVMFYVADRDFVQIVVTSEQVVVTNIADEQMLSKTLIAFLDAAFPAEIVVARVRGDAFEAGRVAVIDEQGSMHTSVRSLGPDSEFPWNEGTIAGFVREAMAELVQS